MSAVTPVLLLGLLIGLPLVHLRSTGGPRWLLVRRVVRGVAWLPPTLLLAMLFFLMFWTPTAWRGDDPMFDEIARVDRGSRSYVAVLVDPGPFQPHTIEIMEQTTILPGVLGWWRLLTRRRDVWSVSLRDRDGALEVVFDPDQPDAETIVVPLR